MDEVTGLETLWEGRGLSAEFCETLKTFYVPGWSPAPPPPPSCAWLYRVKLTFSGNVSATNLDDFPVLVKLTAANFDFSHAQAAGQDIRFMDDGTCPSDGTPLSHEIENWDHAGETAYVWVNVPRIDGGSAADFIYLYYGNVAAADGQDVPGTWNSNYKGVWHEYDDPDTSHFQDSTINANHATKNAAGSPSEAAFGVYRGQLFDGSNDCALFVENNTLDQPADFSIECFMFRASPHLSGGDSAIFYKYGAPSNKGYALVTNQTTGKAQGWVVATAVDVVTSTNSVENNVVHYLVFTRDLDGNLLIYVDGVQSCVPVASHGGSIATTTQARTGSDNSTTQRFSGNTDELRVSNVVLTPDWIKAQYLSMTYALITYGAEEPG